MFHESESTHGEIDQLLVFQPDSLRMSKYIPKSGLRIIDKPLKCRNACHEIRVLSGDSWILNHL